MTYVQAIDNAIEILNVAIATDPDMFENMEATVDKLIALKEQAMKRGSSKAPTKTQKENEVIMEQILISLADIGTPCTVTELLAHGIEGYELTNQKASALLRKLKEAGKVSKTIEGKKAMFCIV